MAGLAFNDQKQTKRPGLWLIPVVLIVVCVLLITISVRVGNTGVFAAVRSGVQTIANPLTSLCSGVSTPFKSVGSGSSYSDDEVDKIVQENAQLKTLVAQLEEYRQQDQRLTTLLELSDTYGLKTVAAKIVGTSSGWNQTATINVGSNQGLQEGMGVMSSCGLYGQVESVSATSATVRLISDATSKVSAMIQNTRSTGIVSGSYDGNLVLDYISVDTTVGEGDVVLTSGEGGTYPRGIIIGTVKSVEVDSSKLYYRIAVDPILNFDSCEEVLVLTGDEDETAGLVDIDLVNEIKSSISSSTSSSSSSSSNTSGTSGTSSSSSTATSTDTSSSSSSDTSSETKASEGFNSGSTSSSTSKNSSSSKKNSSG
jgi:rod shape-determining protein MreC